MNNHSKTRLIINNPNHHSFFQVGQKAAMKFQKLEFVHCQEYNKEK